MITVLSMVLQEDEDRLPASPQDWNVRSRLHTPSRAAITGEFRDEQLVYLDVNPADRGNGVVSACRGDRCRRHISPWVCQTLRDATGEYDRQAFPPVCQNGGEYPRWSPGYVEPRRLIALPRQRTIQDTARQDCAIQCDRLPCHRVPRVRPQGTKTFRPYVVGIASCEWEFIQWKGCGGDCEGD